MITIISMAALLNGKRNREIHWQHHAARLAVEIVLAVGFILL